MDNEKTKKNARLVEKWQKLNFISESNVDGKKNDFAYSVLSEKRKLMVASLLESTEKTIKESTMTSDVQNFIPVLIPVLRRTIPGLIAFDLCGTQPLNTPHGLIFAIVPTFDGTLNNELEPDDTKILKLEGRRDSATEGAFIFQGNSVDGTTASGVVRNVTADGTAMLVEVLSGDFAATPSGSDENNIYVGAEGGDWSDDAANKAVLGVFQNVAMWNILMDNYGGPYATEDAEYLGNDIKEMGFKITKTTVEVKTHKLKARYSLELEADLKNVHGLDAEQEIQSFLSAQISTEINAILLSEMKRLAIAGGMITYDYSSIDSGDGRWEYEKYKNLVSKIEGMANSIFKATRRGKGNFIVASPNVVSILTMLSNGLYASSNENISKISSSYDPNNGYAGMFNNMKVYVDPWNEEDYLLIGYKGNNEFDAGLFFCPYVALQAVKTSAQDSGNPVIFMHSRYGYKENPFGGHNYFRYIKVENIPFYA